MKKLLSASLLLILMLSWTTPAFAQGGDGQPGQVIFGNDLRLEEGDVIEGDVVVFGGDLEMADGSSIEGDVVVFGGSGEINGEVDGDAAFIGGSIKLGSTAEINGDVASIGGEVDVDEDAYVRGRVIETTEFDFGRIPFPQTGAVPPPPKLDLGRGFDLDPLGRFLGIAVGFARGLLMALVVSAIGLLAILFLPDHTQTVEQTVKIAAPTSFGVGVLTLIVGVTVVVLLSITICLAPVALLLALALLLATLYGWIVVGYLLGRRILRGIQKDEGEPTPVASVLVGTFIVTLLQQLLMVMGRVPCLGFLFWLLGAGLWLIIAATGLGAVVLTRFGTQAYQPSTPPALPPTPSPGPAQLETPAAPEVEGEPNDALPEPEGEPTDTTPEIEDEAANSPDEDTTD